MMNYTDEQAKVINNYLTECIKNNYHCQHCAKNYDGICFFAFLCFANDMMYFDDGEDAVTAMILTKITYHKKPITI